LLFWPPLWSSGQSFWLQIQRPGFGSRPKQIFWEVVGLERGAISLVSTIEGLRERKGSGSCLESREYGCREPSHWPRGTVYPQKLALTSLTSGGRSVGIVRLRTQATEFVFCILFWIVILCIMHDVWWLGSVSWAVYVFMYFDMFYIQWHHLAKKDVFCSWIGLHLLLSAPQLCIELWPVAESVSFMTRKVL
jgi:hypothetical protein